jgi:site-specific recombinase XerC
VADAGLITFAVAQDVTEAIADWNRWLESERRASTHTADAYRRDLAAFFLFSPTTWAVNQPSKICRT